MQKAFVSAEPSMHWLILASGHRVRTLQLLPFKPSDTVLRRRTRERPIRWAVCLHMYTAGYMSDTPPKPHCPHRCSVAVGGTMGLPDSVMPDLVNIYVTSGYGR